MNNLLNNPINALKELERELHDKSEASLAQKVNEVIASLEAIDDKGLDDASKANKVMKVIGDLLTKLPAIIDLLDRFNE